MASQSGQVWALARSQHGVITRRQLIQLGYTLPAIRHRLGTGRLHPLHPSVYAVGRREITRDGHLIAAVLACGEGAALSHNSAAELWEIRPRAGRIEVSVTSTRHPRPQGITVHRRAKLDPTRHRGIPVTTPVATLVDLATRFGAEQLERAVNEAMNRDLTEPDGLREAAGAARPRPGAGKLARLLARQTFTMTDTILEQWFLPITRRAGLPEPLTQVYVTATASTSSSPSWGSSWRPTACASTAPRRSRPPTGAAIRRHAVAGLTPLRFTHAQIRFEPDYVAATLAAVARQRRAEKRIEEWQR